MGAIVTTTIVTTRTLPPPTPSIPPSNRPQSRRSPRECVMASCGHGPVMLDLTLRLSAKARECESWQLVARAWSVYASELRRELDMVDARGYIVRTRTQDVRDTWLDQVDLRREEQGTRDLVTT